MANSIDFNDLFVLDIANNHQGDIKHGIEIIKNHSLSFKGKLKNRLAFKFQFRQLESFIHKNFLGNKDIKHLDRFESTKLSPEEYEILFRKVRKLGHITMCTPFDEQSVVLIENMKFDIIKIASCSNTDWPLIQRVVDSGIPIICSTGGLEIEQIDNLVSFFEHKGADFAIMHCVSLYPTPEDLLAVNQIELLKKRYPNTVVGWSTHEKPENYEIIKIAYAKGARIFERHIGLETSSYKLNKYSSTQKQIKNWLNAWISTKEICGKDSFRNISSEEIKAIEELKRGIYARKNIKKNKILSLEDVYFAMPLQKGQLSSSEWNLNLKTLKDIKKDGQIKKKLVKDSKHSNIQIIKNSIHKIKAMLNLSKIYLNSDFSVEFSHHYGIEKFHKYGATIINCINRAYCKKLVVMFAGQKHPPHFHKLKEETFQILSGEMFISLDGKIKQLLSGDTILIQPGAWHSFWAEKDCIFEEISTTHFNNDSFYKDKLINKKKREDRKTFVDHWGRFQIVP